MFLSLFFAFCLHPIVVGELDVNFLFLILPFALIFYRQEVQLPDIWIISCIVFYMLIFFPTIFVFSDVAFVLERRIVSLFAFLAMFAFCFVNFDKKYQTAFEWGLILFGLYNVIGSFSLYLLYLVAPILDMKDFVGSQRSGVVLIFGVWIALEKLLSEEISRRKQLILIGIFSILVLGVFLTFSRAIVLGFILSALAFLMHLRNRERRQAYLGRQTFFALSIPKGQVFLIVISVCVIAILFRGVVFHTTLNFVMNTFSGQIFEAMTIYQDSSEGKRVVFWTSILGFIVSDVSHFLLGSGHTGYWVVSGLGSPHSQYFDVLLRVGVPGMVLYLVILGRLGMVLYNKRSHLLWPYLGVLAYGLFHESFKEPNGTLVLAYLMAITFSKSTIRQRL